MKYILYNCCIEEIERETNTLFITTKSRYNKKTLRPVGFQWGYGSPSQFEILNTEEKEKYIEKRDILKDLRDKREFIFQNIRSENSGKKIRTIYDLMKNNAN